MTVSGWGNQVWNVYSKPVALHSVDVPGIPFSQCEEVHRGNLTVAESVLGSMLCAGDIAEGGIDSCTGDSGGRYLESIP